MLRDLEQPGFLACMFNSTFLFLLNNSIFKQDAPWYVPCKVFANTSTILMYHVVVFK